MKYFFYLCTLALVLGSNAFATGDGPKGPYVIYNPDLNQFLLVYAEGYNVGADTYLKIKILDGNGSEQLPQPAALESDIGSSSERVVSAVYNPDMREYAIVNVNLSGNIDLRRISAEFGTQIGSTVTVASSRTKPMIGYDSKTKNYLVTYNDNHDVEASFFDSSLSQLSGSPFVLFIASPAIAEYSAVVGNGKGQFAIAYIDGDKFFFDVRDANGTDTTPINTEYSTLSDGSTGVAVAYNHLKDEYAVAFVNGTIELILIDKDGSSNPITTLDTGVALSASFVPSIAYNEKGNQFVVGYSDDSSPGKIFTIKDDLDLATLDELGNFGSNNISDTGPYAVSLAANTRCGSSIVTYHSDIGTDFGLDFGISGPVCVPEVSASHSVLDFGDTGPGAINELSATFQAELGAVKVGFLSVSGNDASSFEITNNDCDEANMNELEDCHIQIKFKPQRDGSHSATLKFPAKNTSDTLSLDKTVSLSGNGTGFARLELLQPSNGEEGVDPKKVKFLWKKYSDSSVKSYKLKVCTDSGMTNCFKRFPNLGR